MRTSVGVPIGSAMSGSEGLVVYAVLLFAGLIVGLLLRFLLTLIVVVTAVAIIGVWLLGWLDPTALSQWPTWVNQYLGGRLVGGEMFFTLGGLVFLVGVLLGVLLTSRLRALERPTPSG